MRVEIEAKEGLKRRLEVAIPAAEVSSEVEKRLKKLSRTAKMDGFRPGKVPFTVVKSRYGNHVYQEVASEIMQSNFYKAVQQEQLRPAGYPHFELPGQEQKKDDPSQEFIFSATFEIMPEIKLVDLKAEKVEKESGNIEDADVDQMLETLRKQHCDWQEVSRAAQDGDRLLVDFKGRKKGGDAFAGGEAENFTVTLGAGAMIPGFEEGFVGLSVNEEKTIEATFPENYQVADLAGQVAEFDVKVHKIEEQKLPEINDEFAKRLEVKGETVDALREELKATMQRELDLAVQSRNKTKVLDLLVTKNTVDLPQALVDSEIVRLRQQMQSQYGQMQGIKAPDLPASMFEEQARKRVLLGLLVAEVIEARELKPDATRVKAMIEKLAAAYEDPNSVVDYYYNNKEKMSEVEAMVMEDQVVDVLLEDAETVDKKVTFSEVMNLQQTA